MAQLPEDRWMYMLTKEESYLMYVCSLHKGPQHQQVGTEGTGEPLIQTDEVKQLRTNSNRAVLTPNESPTKAPTISTPVSCPITNDEKG